MTEVATEEGIETPTQTGREGLDAAFAKVAESHGLDIPDRMDGSDEPEQVVKLKADGKDGKPKVKDAHSATPKAEEPAPEVVKAREDAAKFFKVPKEVLDSMGPELAGEHLDRLAKIRKDTAKALSAKAGDDGAETPASTDTVPDESDFTDADWGDDKGLSKLNAQAKQIKALNARLEKYEQSANLTHLDRFLDTLPKEVRSQFGDGPTDDFDDDSPELDARAALMRRALSVVRVEAEQGRQISLRTALKEALRGVAGDSLDKVTARNAVRRERNKARMPRSSSDDGGGTPGLSDTTNDALASVANKHGLRLPDRA